MVTSYGCIIRARWIVVGHLTLPQIGIRFRQLDIVTIRHPGKTECEEVFLVAGGVLFRARKKLGLHRGQTGDIRRSEFQAGYALDSYESLE